MTFMFKQCTWYWCSNNTSRWMTSMFIPYKPMKNKFHTTIIAKSLSGKFVMCYINIMIESIHNGLICSHCFLKPIVLTFLVGKNVPWQQQWRWIWKGTKKILIDIMMQNILSFEQIYNYFENAITMAPCKKN